MKDSAEGLQFTCKLPPTTQANDLAASIDRQDLDGVSFGFSTVEDRWTSDGAGNGLRTLLKIKLFEISPCSFPAYPSTSVRSCPKELRCLIRTSSEDDDADECDCDCPECLAGDCEDCSNPDCDDEACDCENRAKRSQHWIERSRMRLE